MASAARDLARRCGGRGGEAGPHSGVAASSSRSLRGEKTQRGATLLHDVLPVEEVAAGHKNHGKVAAMAAVVPAQGGGRALIRPKRIYNFLTSNEETRAFYHLVHSLHYFQVFVQCQDG